MAALARLNDDAHDAARWDVAADTLRVAVEARFWQEDLQFYALALDGGGRPCRVRASNAGHLLYCGLPSRERGCAVARQLLSCAFDTGWGVRTLASGTARYNPMSYHNGSVWPHDVALCAAGLGRYGERAGVVRLLGELFETSANFGLRLPELFCGFERAAGEAPVAYPVACLPQAWAAGSVFMALQACLGVTIDAHQGSVLIDRPRLPSGVDSLQLRRLRIGGRVVDLGFQRLADRVVAIAEQPAHQVPLRVDLRL
jgi:glycogen debranching enzyme